MGGNGGGGGDGGGSGGGGDGGGEGAGERGGGRAGIHGMGGGSLHIRGEYRYRSVHCRLMHTWAVRCSRSLAADAMPATSRARAEESGRAGQGQRSQTKAVCLAWPTTIHLASYHSPSGRIAIL